MPSSSSQFPFPFPFPIHPPNLWLLGMGGGFMGERIYWRCLRIYIQEYLYMDWVCVLYPVPSTSAPAIIKRPKRWLSTQEVPRLLHSLPAASNRPPSPSAWSSVQWLLINTQPRQGILGHSIHNPEPHHHNRSLHHHDELRWLLLFRNQFHAVFNMCTGKKCHQYLVFLGVTKILCDFGI